MKITSDIQSYILFLSTGTAVLFGASASAQSGWRHVEFPPLNFTHVSANESPISSATPQLAPQSAGAIRPGQKLTADTNHMYYDQSADGTVWARGKNYKASFGTAGSAIIPFLGSSAPRNFPVTFSLASASVGGASIDFGREAAAARGGSTVSFERGPIREVYDLTVDSIEQSFDLVQPLGHGDVVLRVGYSGELEAAATTSGIRFSNELGAVEYSKAIAIDAHGSSVELATTLVDGAIQLTVPATFLGHATFPVRVDPTITVLPVSQLAIVEHDPDVAFDNTTGRMFYTWEMDYSATDHDVYMQLMESNGTLGAANYIDFTTSYWAAPKIGSFRAFLRLLVAAVVGDPAAGPTQIFGRITGSDTNIITGQFQISDTSPGSMSQVDVGGDSTTDTTHSFIVVWTHTVPAGLRHVNVRLVSPAGIPANLGAFETGSATDDYAPRVSNTNDGTTWTVVWEEQVTPTNHDIEIARVAYNAPAISFGTLSGTIDDDIRPNVSTMMDGTNRYLVTFERRVAGNSDIACVLVNDTTVDISFDLSVDDGTASANTIYASSETDGSHFAVTYVDQATSLVKLTELYVVQSSPISVGIVQGGIAFDSTNGGSPSISGYRTTGSPGRQMSITYARSGDIYAALFNDTIGGPISSYCFGDGSGTTCPCGNAGIAGHGCANSVNAQGALLTGSGQAAMGADTLVLNGAGMPPNSTCLYFQGTAASAGGTVFGDGLQCVGGSVVRLGTKANDATGASHYPAAGDLSVSVRGLLPAVGGIRAYQVWYRNPANFCTSSTFNLSNGVQLAYTP